MHLRLLIATATLFITACSSSDSGDPALTESLTFEDEQTPNQAILGPDRAEAALQQIVSILNIDALQTLDAVTFAVTDDLAEQAEAVINGEAASNGMVLASQTLLSDANAANRVTELGFTCANAGSLRQIVTEFSGGAPFDRRELSFDDCQIGDSLYTGNYEHDSGFRSDRVTSFDSFERTNASVVERLTGVVTQPFSPLAIETTRWSATQYQREDANGQWIITDFSFERSGQDTPLVGDAVRRFVTDLEGIEREIIEVAYTANLSASFAVSDATDAEPSPTLVSADLAFNGNYFEWAGTGDSPVPAYPVSDLGTPLATRPGTDADNAPTQFIDQQARNSQAQWQSGQVVVTAADGSVATLRPNPDDAGSVTIELSATNETLTRPVSEGFQIDCPAIIDGCGASNP